MSDLKIKIIGAGLAGCEAAWQAAKLGVKVDCLGDNIFFDASNAKANKIKLRIPSVGATENIIQFASKLKGVTTIQIPGINNAGT